MVTDDRWETYAGLQSRVHQVWSLQFGGMVGETPSYNPSRCFGCFPFPTNPQAVTLLMATGQMYYEHRADLMIDRNEGMTETYNRFQSSREGAEDIRRLRELHATIDRAMLEAYGWHDLVARAEPIFLDETNEDDHSYQGCLFWPSDFRDEVLARLLDRNAKMAMAEGKADPSPNTRAKPDEPAELEEA